MKDKALEARLTAYLHDTEGLIVIESLSEPDSLDREHFAAFWWDWRSLRAQHFFCVLEEFKARETRIDGTPRRIVTLDDVPLLGAGQLELEAA